jgi:hypothetical protein
VRENERSEGVSKSFFSFIGVLYKWLEVGGGGLYEVSPNIIHQSPSLKPYSMSNMMGLDIYSTTIKN